MRYMVTGATGFIGGQVARQLRAQGHEVRALVREPSAARDLSALGVELFPGDILERASLRRPMEGVDGVFHLAAWYKIGAKDSSAAARINIDGTRNVLESMRELKVPKGVYTSTVGVFSDTHGKVVDESYQHQGRFLSVYEATKWRAHYEVALPMVREGLPLVIVMPGAVFGPGDRSEFHELIVRYLRGKLRAVPRVTAFCFASVEDTARGHLLAMAKGVPGSTYILAGEPCTVDRLLEIAQRTTGVPPPRFHPPAGFVRCLAAVSGSERLKAATATYLASHAKATRELGYEPRSLAEAFPETLRFEMERLNRP